MSFMILASQSEVTRSLEVRSLPSLHLRFFFRLTVKVLAPASNFQLLSSASSATHLRSFHRYMAGGGTTRSMYGPWLPRMASGSGFTRLKWPLGGTSYGQAPWNSPLLLALELGLQASRVPPTATPAAPMPKTWSTRRRDRSRWCWD